MILRMQSAISLFTCCCFVSTASANSSNVGLVMTTGSVQVDGQQVPGTAAIFSGSLVSSQDRSSNLQFSDGTSATMRPGAAMTVYQEHSILQHGVALQRGVDKHPLVADGLRISGATPNAVVLVGVKDAVHIEVAAQEGESDVWTSSGNLVARVESGKPLSFALNEAAGNPANGVVLSGILRSHSLLTDEVTNVTYQLQGRDLDPLVGASVQVTGTVQSGNPSSSTPQIIAVSNIVRLTPYAAMGGAGQAKPPGASRKGAIAFLVFVAAGLTLLGFGLSGAFGTSPSAVTPTTP